MGGQLGDERYHRTNKLRGQGEAEVSYAMIPYKQWRKHPKEGERAWTATTTASRPGEWD